MISSTQLARLFVIRLITATSLYLLLANGHSLFTTREHAFVFGGYRLLLIFSPVFTLILKSWAMVFLLIAASMSAFYCMHATHGCAIFVLTLGLSCGGLLVKQQAAETPRSAAYNKWAVTFGPIVSGLCIPYLLNQHGLTFLCVGLLLAFGSIVSMFSRTHASGTQMEQRHLTIAQSPTRCMAWLLCGIAIGIRVTSLLMIMPQYLLTIYEALPSWYGMMLSMYGVMVILAQLPAILKTTQFSFFSSLSALFASCFILGFPAWFYVQAWWGAWLWLFCLAIEEIFAPYIDVAASKQRTLLYKEMGTGLGACLSVYLMRTHPCPALIGAIGLAAIALAYSLKITRTPVRKTAA